MFQTPIHRRQIPEELRRRKECEANLSKKQIMRKAERSFEAFIFLQIIESVSISRTHLSIVTYST